MGFSRPYDRFLDLLKRTLPRASDTADKRTRVRAKRKEQTRAFTVEGTTCGISRPTREELENSFAARPPVRKPYVPKSERSKESGIEAWKDRVSLEGENVAVRKSYKQQLLFFPIFIHDRFSSFRIVFFATIIATRWKNKIARDNLPRGEKRKNNLQNIYIKKYIIFYKISEKCIYCTRYL